MASKKDDKKQKQDINPVVPEAPVPAEKEFEKFDSLDEPVAPSVPENGVPENTASTPGRAISPEVAKSLKENLPGPAAIIPEEDSEDEKALSGSKFHLEVGNLSGTVNTIKRYLIFIILTGAFVAISLLVIWPQFKRYQEISSERGATEAEFEKVSAHLTYLRNLQSLQSQLVENIELSEQAIPLENDVPFLLNQLMQIAQESGVEVTEQSFAGLSTDTVGSTVAAPTVPVAEDPVPDPLADDTLIDALPGLGDSSVEEVAPPPPSSKKFVVQMTIVGSYDGLITFLEGVENARRLATLSEFDLSVYDGKGSSEIGVEGSGEEDNTIAQDRYELSLTFTSYYMPGIDTANLSVAVLVTQPALEPVLNYLRQSRLYTNDLTGISIGVTNPFFDDSFQPDEDEIDVKVEIEEDVEDSVIEPVPE